MGMQLDQGGHLTHGASVNFSGNLYQFVPYGVDRDTETIDYDEVERLALEHKPKLIVAGCSAYARILDFPRFRAIADMVGAYLMVDMAHIAGLVAGGAHPSPIPHAHVVTSTTQKTLRGPRGGLILCTEDLARKIDYGVFPYAQGGPFMHVIAAKAVCFGEALKPEFANHAAQVVANCQALARGSVRSGAAVGVGRHRQPPGAGGPEPPEHHRQGRRGRPGRCWHHRQQECHPLRYQASQSNQRVAPGNSGHHQSRLQGIRHREGSPPDSPNPGRNERRGGQGTGQAGRWVR